MRWRSTLLNGLKYCKQPIRTQSHDMLIQYNSPLLSFTVIQSSTSDLIHPTIYNGHSQTHTQHTHTTHTHNTHTHLDECLAPDHVHEGLQVLGEVHVQHESAPHLLKSPETGGVAGLVEVGHHIPQLRVQLQKLLEGTAHTHTHTHTHTKMMSETPHGVYILPD